MSNDNSFNLITTAWIPLVRSSGSREVVRPADLTLGIETDPFVDIDWPRPDLRCATLEFLIGLLALACPPREIDDWIERWEVPPSVSDLEAALTPLRDAFAFDGDGPRAYQDFEDLAAEPNSVEALLIESPGAQTVRNNAALLVKPGRIGVLSRASAAGALMTLQTMAPAGGAGIRTSLRGGGPLTTLVVPSGRASLWHRLWANVPAGGEAAERASLPRVFPWLVPTRVSGKDGHTTTPVDVDELQMFFGMPRRVRLDFEPNVERVACDLSGEIDDVIVRTYRTRPHGTNYDAWGGRHPLTPHYRSKPGDPVLYPVHGQSGRMGYRQWVAMLYGDAEKTRAPAACVSLFMAQRIWALGPGERDFRLVAAGYDMDNMKARAFVEAETPEIVAPEGDVEGIAEKARGLVKAASVAAVCLNQALKLALYGDGAEVGNDKTPVASARERFWADTNDSFFDVLNAVAAGVADADAVAGEPPYARVWQRVLRTAALSVFDDTAPMSDATSNDVKRVIDGRRFLVGALTGYGKQGKEFLASLKLPLPETKARKSERA